MNFDNSSAIILGAGASIQDGINLDLWRYLDHQIVFSLNDMFQKFEGTVVIANDTDFYRDRKEKLKSKGLVIARYDTKYGRDEYPLNENTILIHSNANYYGKASIKQGCYTGVLAGLFTLSLTIGLGFKKIFLLGMDCCEWKGKTHVYQDEADLGKLTDFEGKPITGMGRNFRNQYNSSLYNKTDKELNTYWMPFLQEHDMHIYNVSEISRISVFPKISYANFIQSLKPINITQHEIRESIKLLINEKLK